MMFPRVLVVSLVRVNAADAINNGLLLRSVFGDWPKENLAQIYSEGANGDEGFFGSYYKLGPDDRWFGKTFYRLKARAPAAGLVPGPTAAIGEGHPGRGSWIHRTIGRLVVDSGFYELVFRPRISRKMLAWISEFQPDVILAQGYTLSFSWLPVMLHRRTGTPLAFFTTDDWPTYVYRDFPMTWLLHRSARSLITHAGLRIAFGDKMRRAFENKYGAPFVSLYHLDAKERFPEYAGRSSRAVRSIAFVGSLYLKRHEALIDLLSVIRKGSDIEHSVAIHVYAPEIPEEVPETLRKAPEIVFYPLPSHDDLPAVLAREDILFMAESFSVDPDAISLSLSTKCHLFMASGTPILAYGPPYSGTIDYAAREGWAAVVTERNAEGLEQALRRLQRDCGYRNELVARAMDVFLRNHELRSGQRIFRNWIASAAHAVNDGGRAAQQES